MHEPLRGEEYAEFIRRIRQGDEAAAADLIRLYEPEVRLEVRTLLRLRDPRLRRVFDSMDVCQSIMVDFFVRAAIGEFDLNEPSQLIRLLVGMARNRVAERVRFHQRHRRDVRRVDAIDAHAWSTPATTETPSEAISNRELLAVLRARLSTEEREIADLRSQGCDWATVARELGGSAEGRRKQLARAVAKVGRELGLAPTVERRDRFGDVSGGSDD